MAPCSFAAASWSAALLCRFSSRKHVLSCWREQMLKPAMLSISQRLELNFQLRLRLQNRHAAGKVEALAAGVAGIQVENAVDGFAEGFVGVAEDDNVRFFAGDARGKLVVRRVRIDDVMDQKFSSVELHDFGVAQRNADVGISKHRGDGSNFFQLQHEPRQSDIAAVEDVFDSRKRSRTCGSRRS